MHDSLSSKLEKEIAKISKVKDIRRGQSYMIALKEVDPDAYMAISGSEADCFFEDNLIPKFYIKLSNIWS